MSQVLPAVVWGIATGFTLAVIIVAVRVYAVQRRRRQREAHSAVPACEPQAAPAVATPPQLAADSTIDTQPTAAGPDAPPTGAAPEQGAARQHSSVLSELLQDERLLAIIEQVESLPSLNEMYQQIAAEMAKPEPSVYRVGHLLSQDLGLAAKVLRLVNSAYFGLARRISSPTEAVILLGLDTVKTLVLSLNVFSSFQRLEGKVLGVSINLLYSHSLATAAFAKRIAQAQRVEARVIDHCFTGGLMHDVGKLVLGTNLPQEYKAVQELAQSEGLAWAEAEQRILGITHAEVGAYLLDQWSLPLPVIEAVAFHHCPASQFSLTRQPSAGRPPEKPPAAADGEGGCPASQFSPTGQDAADGPDRSDRSDESDRSSVQRPSSSVFRPSSVVNRPSSFSPLTAVYVANHIEHLAYATGKAVGELPADMDYLAGIGLAERVERWQELCHDVLVNEM